MFANSKVAWPPEVKTLLALLRCVSCGWLSSFHVLNTRCGSIFNFNLEIVAPECTIPNVGFTDKWFFVMALPIAAAAIFIVMHILQYLQKRVIFGQRTKLHSHAPTLVAMLLNIMCGVHRARLRAAGVERSSCAGTSCTSTSRARCWISSTARRRCLPMGTSALDAARVTVRVLAVRVCPAGTCKRFSRSAESQAAFN